MHRREFVLGAAGIVGASTIGSVAYTNASVDRSVTVNVTDDSSAIIGLVGSSSIVTTTTDGKLKIDTSSLSSNLNKDATFKFGDTTDPASNPAFKVVNNAGSDKTLSVDLSGFSGTFTLYPAGQSSISSNNSGSLGTLTANGGEVQLAIKIGTATTNENGTMSITDS